MLSVLYSALRPPIADSGLLASERVFLPHAQPAGDDAPPALPPTGRTGGQLCSLCLIFHTHSVTDQTSLSTNKETRIAGWLAPLLRN